MIYNELPVLGFAAWSGTGKTTLLTKMIPLLKERGYRLGIVKHVHHKFDIDIPGKDSYKLRKAGAMQVIAASRHRLAYIRELETPKDEPSLREALGTLETSELDLILVEGYKHETVPKIELSRKEVQRPLLYPKDSRIFAIACDYGDEIEAPIDVLDINQPDKIVDYIIEWAGNIIATNNSGN